MKTSWPAALLALAWPALPALADVGSSATLTGLRYELVDLRPGDGVAPTIRYTGVAWAESFTLWDSCRGASPWCQRSEGSFTNPAFSSRETVVGGPTSAFAAVSPAGLFAAGQWANGSNLGGGNGRYRAVARLQGVADGRPLFVLSAHTGVRITAQYTLDAWVDPTEIVGPYRKDYAASAGLFFHSRFMDGSSVLEEIDHRDGHATGELSVLLRNDRDRQGTIWGRWGVLAEGQVPVGIPEPSTWALLLGGIGLVGVTARRRRSGQAPAPPA